MKRTKKICDKCNTEISLSNFNSHYEKCTGVLYKSKLDENWKTTDGNYKCPHCGKIFSNKGIGSHIWRIHGDGKLHNPNKGYEIGTRSVWNKGLTKETDERMQRVSDTYKASYVVGNVKHWTHGNDVTLIKEKLSIAAKNRKLGGYNPNSIKKHKSGLYKGYWCDSSWELAWVVFNIEHNIPFYRNTKKFDYVLDGKTKKFIPDFIFEDGTYIEIKGYMGRVAKAKFQYFKEKIIIIESKKIKKYIDYVVDKYGVNFIELYE